MGESYHQATASSKLGMMRNSGGEIVEVQGGHIVRSIGRKDRHSKVCTAKGPRDRRVRLSAPTAIQFYDVQDRLGYDRPSKAVDWLIKKAKAAIDELAELPAWRPNTSRSTSQLHMNQEGESSENLIGIHCDLVNSISSRRPSMVGSDGGVSENTLQNLQHSAMRETSNNNRSNLLPPSSLNSNSNSLADTMKSFFPMGAAAAVENQDLRLSLQSFQDPMLMHHHHHHQARNQSHQNEHVLFSGTSPLGLFDGASTAWSGQNNHPAAEISRFKRMVSWNADTGTGGTGDAGAGSGIEGFAFNPPPTPVPPTPPLLQPLFGESQFFSQRGPLQSSNTPSVRAWIDPPITVTDQIPPPFHQSSYLGYGIGSGRFSGFHIPARIQGEEEHDGIPHKPFSASSNSRH